MSATNTTGVPGLLLAATEGGVALANAHGSGVLDDPALASYWAPAIAGLTGTHAAARPARRPTTSPPRCRRSATVPAGTATAVLRLHAVAGPDGVTVMTGGNGRVLDDGDDPRRPTARLAKDVWVIGAARPVPVLVAPLPQVDLRSSVPTRAADAMFWLGRAAERAEAVAKAARVIASRRQTDPSLATFEGGRWARRMAHVLRVVRDARVDDEVPEGRPVTVLDAELAAASIAVGERLSAVLAEAATVGEYLSVTAGRVLGNLAASRAELADGRPAIDVLDATIADLATFIGLWDESTVHGPAWRFGDLGRRIERSVVVLGLVEACLGPLPAGLAADEPAADEGADVAELAEADLVERAGARGAAGRQREPRRLPPPPPQRRRGRRRHPPAAPRHRQPTLVPRLRQPDGRPRGGDRLDRGPRGDRRASPASSTVMTCSMASARPSSAVQDFGALVVDTWFATPVNPMVVRGRLR